MLITLLASVAYPVMAETLSFDISDGFVTVRTPEHETRTINTFAATNNYNTDSTCLIDFKGAMQQTSPWNELPAGTVINNTDIKHNQIKLNLLQGVKFTNNGTIDVSFQPWSDVDYFNYNAIEVHQGSTFTNNGSVTASLWAQNDSKIIAAAGSEFFGEIQLGYAESNSYASLMVEGAVTMNLSESLNIDNGSLILTEGSSLDMKGGAITLGDTSAIIYQVDGTADASVRANELFRNANIGDDVAITVKGSDGTEYKTTLGALTVPEPTTATLSLLALVGLAARRRRASR